jgi:putative flavoprotein involved in K+ transport
MSSLYDTIVIGAGQTGLASAYYLQRAGSRSLVLDGGSHIGEPWLRRWDSLRLFTRKLVSHDAHTGRGTPPV